MIVVAGVANVEVCAPVEGWPVAYVPVRYPRGEITARASGVGFRTAAALAALGRDVRFATFVADDALGRVVGAALRERGLYGDAVVEGTATPRSVVLYGPDGSRMVSTDLRDLPDAVYPTERFKMALAGADLAVVTNIGFARPLLAVAGDARVPVAVDVQAIDSLDDGYNADWLRSAEIVFCSHERLPVPPTAWASGVVERYGCSIVVVGMGADGALLQVADEPARQVPAVAPRGVANTVGAGDALASGFLAAYQVTGDPHQAIEYGVTFAGFTVGARGDEDQFCSWDRLVGLTQAAFAGMETPSSS